MEKKRKEAEYEEDRTRKRESSFAFCWRLWIIQPFRGNTRRIIDQQCIPKLLIKGTKASNNVLYYLLELGYINLVHCYSLKISRIIFNNQSIKREIDVALGRPMHSEIKLNFKRILTIECILQIMRLPTVGTQHNVHIIMQP